MMAIEPQKIVTVGSLPGQIFQELPDNDARTPNGRNIVQGASGKKLEDIGSATKHVTIADMRAMGANGVPSASKNLKYLTKDYGSKGSWIVDETDTTTADDTGTCVVTADGVRIKREIDDCVRLEWYNTWHNGSNSDLDRLRAAVAAAKRLNVKVKIKNFGAPYYIGSSITTDVSIEGVGMPKILGDKSLFIINSDNITISGLYTQMTPGTVDDNVPYCYFLNSAGLKNITIRDCFIKDGTVRATLSSNNPFQNIKFINNVVDVDFSTMINLDGQRQNDIFNFLGCQGLLIAGNTISSLNVNRVFKINVSTGTTPQPSKNVKIVNNTIKSKADHSIALGRQIFDFYMLSSDVIISNNYIEVDGHSDVIENKTKQEMSDPLNFIITDNIIKSNGKITSFRCSYSRTDINSKLLNVVFKGNDLQLTGDYGFTESTPAIDLRRCHSIDFSHNTVSGIIRSESSLYNHALWLQNIENCNIKDNYLHNTDIWVTTVAQDEDGNSTEEIFKKLSIENNYFSLDSWIQPITINEDIYDDTSKINYIYLKKNTFLSRDGLYDVNTRPILLKNINAKHCVIEDNIADSSYTDGVKITTCVIDYYDEKNNSWPDEAELTGTSIDLRKKKKQYASISADTTFTLQNTSFRDARIFQVTNTDTNPHTVSITGVNFADGTSAFVIPASSSVQVKLNSVNSVLTGWANVTPPVQTGVSGPLKIIDDDYTLTLSDYTIIYTGSATGVITLPDPTTCKDQIFKINNRYQGGNITTSRSLREDTSTTTTDIATNTTVTIQSDGTEWWVILIQPN